MTTCPVELRHHQHSRRRPRVARRRNVTVFGAKASIRCRSGSIRTAAGAQPDAADVIPAIQQQSQQVTAGQSAAAPTCWASFQLTLNVNGRLDDKDSSRTSSSRPAMAEMSPACATLGWSSSAPRPQPDVFAQQQAGDRHRRNPVARCQRARGRAGGTPEKMAALAKGFPQDIRYDTPFDTTKFVSDRSRRSARPSSRPACLCSS
jgi:HAE1 family hydrophobic/amphiphilic exporter-1